MLWVLIRIASPILMSTHNVSFYGELTKIILQLSSNTLLVCSTGLLPVCQQFPFPYFYCACKNASLTTSFFLLICWILFPYVHALSVLFSCGSGQNYDEISKNSVRSIRDVCLFFFHWRLVTMTLTVTFQGMWALILALILISACISARELKFNYQTNMTMTLTFKI